MPVCSGAGSVWSVVHVSAVGRESGSWYAALDLCEKTSSVVKLQEGVRREAGGRRSDRGYGLRLRGGGHDGGGDGNSNKVEGCIPSTCPSFKRHATSLRFPRESRRSLL